MNLHFIAIGGAAMHNLAIALQNKGYKISGSDDVIFNPSKQRLADNGLLPETFGWFPDKIHSSLDAIVLGMHAKADNPELIKAQQLGLKIYSYPEFLFEQSKAKTRVVIGGSHGKTTITAMVLHVMHYHNRDVDFMVGAQLEGFDVMVKLTDTNDFIILEGDEYLSSTIDKRPKFHLYKPNIALLSGIAWDHINVFPTFENYVEQFKIFIETITLGGSITYNAEDKQLQHLVENSNRQIRKITYHTPNYEIENGKTLLHTPDGLMPIELFGEHNLNNLAGAKWICQHIGVDEDDFYEAIASFKGASKRLEKITASKNNILYKDFAHSPSKVKASTSAVKTQHPNKTLIACLELHTYSSLNATFLKQYHGTLDAADTAVVYFSPEALKIKQLEGIMQAQILQAFQKENLIIFTNTADLLAFLAAQKLDHTVLLLMSSGNYGGLDFEAVKALVSV